MTDIRSLTVTQTESFLLATGGEKFRGRQIFEWVNKRHVSSFAEMTNISKSLREKLEKEAYLSSALITKRFCSDDDPTIKYLFEFDNNNAVSYVESVFLKYAHGNTVCVSTQAGCRMGCAFCASTQNGLEGSLTAGEMAAQVYEISKDAGERVSNIVLMGSGEPLDNYANVMQFIRIINSEYGANIGQRHITLSTCGLTDKIYELLKENLQITLAVSLHAPNDDIRNRIMPVSRKFDMDGLLKACKAYSDKTKRRITFEYALIAGVNDSKENAAELAKRLRNMLCHVNLIPVNEVAGSGYKKSAKENIEAFAKTLAEHHIEATVRRKLGSGINAACGQLRNKML